MKIWIDADACPKGIKEIVYRASDRLNLSVCLVANRRISIPGSPRITLVHVSQGLDVADNYILKEVRPEDIVVTADIPLAAQIVEKGALAINPRGELYTEHNVGEKLSLRDFMQDLRNSGLLQGGPAQFGAGDKKRFAAALDQLLAAKSKIKG